MDEQYRLDLMHAIEDRRGSKLICYITSDRMGLPGPIWWPDVRVVERHLSALAASKSTKKLDFLIYTPGGDALAPWSMVSMIREYMGSRPFSVLIPSMAMSAGTMISIGSDEIVMGPGAHIGPIDIQLGQGLSVEDVHGYFQLADDMGLKAGDGRLNAFVSLARAIHPVLLGQLQRVRNEGERAALLLLASRRKPLGDAANRKIAHHLLREVGIHGQTIRRTEARSCGMSFVSNAEEVGILPEMTALFEQYEELLRLDVPYVGQGRSWDQDDPFMPASKSSVIEDPIAVVESIDRMDVARYAYGYRFWRDAPINDHQRTPAGAEARIVGKLAGRPMPGRFSVDDVTPRVEPLSEGHIDGSLKQQMSVSWEATRRGKVGR